MGNRFGLTLASIFFLAALLCGCKSTDENIKNMPDNFDKSNSPKEEVLQSLQEMPIAHRGLYNNENGIPENSLSAFDAAAENGYPIELDVQITADGQLAVFHDSTMSRMTGNNCKIADHTLSEVCRIKLLDSDEHVPSFKEVLTCVNGRVPILIEIKIVDGTNNERQRIIEALDNELNTYEGKIAVQSFDVVVVKEFSKRHDGKVSVGLICPENETLQDIPGSENFDFIGINIEKLNSDIVKSCHNTGQMILAWTSKTPEMQEKACKIGADSVVFEGYLPNTL